MKIRLLHQTWFRIFGIVSPLFHWRHAGQKTYVREFGESTRLKMRTNLYDRWAAYEVWDREEYRDDLLPIHPSDIVVDIGAHIGAFSVWAARQAPLGRVYAFEPNPENHALLLENMRLNGLDNMEAHNLAVSDCEGEISIFHSKYSSLSHSIFEEGNEGGAMVRSVSLASILEDCQIERVNYLKVDAEGAEYPILLNASPQTLSRVDKIFVEFHDYLDHGHDYTELADCLARNGFRVEMGRNFWSRFFLKIGYIKAVRIPAG